MAWIQRPCTSSPLAQDRPLQTPDAALSFRALHRPVWSWFPSLLSVLQAFREDRPRVSVFVGYAGSLGVNQVQGLLHHWGDDFGGVIFFSLPSGAPVLRGWTS